MFASARAPNLDVLGLAKVKILVVARTAEVMGIVSEIGNLEVGKRAGVIVVNLQHIHPRARDIGLAIVYTAESSDVETVLIDGQVVLREVELLTMNEGEISEVSQREAELFQRAGTNLV